MKRLAFFFLFAALAVVSADAQVTKSLLTEKNGFQWNKVYGEDVCGAESADGSTLIPLSRGYSNICFYTKGDGGYFGVWRKGVDGVGACDINGREVIAPGRYHQVFYHEAGNTGYYSVENSGGKQGACDIYGREIIAPEFKYILYNSGVFKYQDESGSFHSTGITLNASGHASSYGFGLSSARQLSSPSPNANTLEFPYYFYYPYDPGDNTGSYVFPLDKSDEDFLCGVFVVRYEFFSSYFSMKLVGVNRRTGAEKVWYSHDVYPSQSGLTLSENELSVIWIENGKTLNALQRTNTSYVLVYTMNDQKIFSWELDETRVKTIETAISYSGKCPAVRHDDYGSKYLQLKSKLLQYSWKQRR